jgi:hypothetical protein
LFSVHPSSLSINPNPFFSCPLLHIHIHLLFGKMPSLVLALSALAAVSVALVTPVQRANQTFTVYENVPKPFVPGPVLLLKAYQKFGVTPPRDILENGHVTAYPTTSNWEYLCLVTIAGQELELQVDTGSSDL